MSFVLQKSGQSPFPFSKSNTNFLAPVSLYGPGHRGLDFVLEAEQRVLAPTSGLVTFSGPVVDRNIVTITSSGGYLLSFEQICSSLLPGDSVRTGTGRLASFAQSTKPLNLTVRAASIFLCEVTAAT